MYDKVSSVISELVANSYDADATEVTISAPMGKYLAHKDDGEIIDDGLTIQVKDDGTGMTPDEVQDFYLEVGGDRRHDEKRETKEKSAIFGRDIMGRKGIGKLAPFGICKHIELISAGGELITNSQGEQLGYLTTHILLDKDKIEERGHHRERDCPIPIGKYNGAHSPKKGTIVILSQFDKRKVPDIDSFERQLSHKFGIESPNWKIFLKNSLDDSIKTIGKFSIPYDKVKYDFVKQEDGFHALYNDSETDEIKAGFDYEGRFYGITGSAGKALKSYRDDLMAGFRIYCRGKLATQTNSFDIKSGFTGEHTAREYLIGALNCDWLDDGEDLIQTDRKDLLWSHELVQEFQQWGQELVKLIAKKANDPQKENTWETVKRQSNIVERAKRRYQKTEQRRIVDSALALAKSLTENLNHDAIANGEYEHLVDLSLDFAPHLTLSEELVKASSECDTPLSAIVKMLEVARVAELATYGLVADERIKIIHRLEKSKDNPNAKESELQKMIQDAQWLINAEWSPITENESFNTVKKELMKFIETELGKTINITDFGDAGNKRVDFVLLNHNGVIELVEIKAPKHKFSDEDFARLYNYIKCMRRFINDPKNVEMIKLFPSFHITLICDSTDDVKVDTNIDLLKRMFDDGTITNINWSSFYFKTTQAHCDFLKLARPEDAR